MMNVSSEISAAGPGTAARRDLEKLRDASGRIVGSVFYGTLFRQMRESGIKGPFGHGGRGEEVFSSQLHGAWAESMGLRAGDGLAEAVYRRLEPQQRIISEQFKPVREAS